MRVLRLHRTKLSITQNIWNVHLHWLFCIQSYILIFSNPLNAFLSMKVNEHISVSQWKEEHTEIWCTKYYFLLGRVLRNLDTRKVQMTECWGSSYHVVSSLMQIAGNFMLYFSIKKKKHLLKQWLKFCIWRTFEIPSTFIMKHHLQCINK